MAADDRSALLARLARDVNCLRDPDRFKRRAGLDALVRALFEPSTSAATRVAVVTQDVARELLELLSDPVEMVRETALTLARRVLTTDGDAAAGPLLLLLMPALVARVGRMPFGEDAEELRLQWSQLLNALLASPPVGRALQSGAAFANIAEVLRTLSGDAFHAVKVEAALGVGFLCAAVPAHVHLVLGGLAGACVANLGHQRAPVRVAAVGALQVLLPLGGESLPTVLHDVVLVALKQHARFDRTASVRRATCAAVSHWLGGALPHHALSSRGAEAQLLVLLCSFAADETHEVAAAAVEAIQAAAAASVVALGAAARGGPSAAGLSRDLAAAAAAAAPDASIHGYDASVTLSEQTAEMHAGTSVPKPVGSVVHHLRDGDDPGGALPPPLLPSPFKSRPSAAARALARRLLPSALALVLAELSDWTVRTRLGAAGSLRTLLVLVEGACVGSLDALISALCTGSRDDDADVRRMLGDAGRLVGALAPPAAQLGVLLPQLRGEVAPLAHGAHYSAALAVLAATLSTMSRDSLAPHLPLLADTLALPALAEDDPPTLRQQLALALAYAVHTGVPQGCFRPLGATPSVRESRDEALPQVALDSFLLALLHLQMGASDDDPVATAGKDTTHTLSRVLRYTSAGAMYGSAISRLLPRILSAGGGAGSWIRPSPARRTFEALLRCHRMALAGVEPGDAQVNVDAVLEAFSASLAPSREPELRVTQLALLDSFIAGPEEGAVWDGVANKTGNDSSRGAPHLLSATQATIAAPAGAAAATARAAALTLSDREASQVAAHSGGTHAVRRVLEAEEHAGHAHASSGSGAAMHSVCHAAVDAALGEASEALVRSCVLPNLVWRVGLVASTVRKIATAALLGALARGLVPRHAAGALVSTLLPALTGCLSDDDATTRHLSSRAIAALLRSLGPGGLSFDGSRLLYPELLKRLDDSNDSVRIAGTAALRELPACTLSRDLVGTASEYTVDILLVHLDDADPSVQGAVYDATLPWAALNVQYALTKARDARSRVRHPAYVDRLIGHLEALSSMTTHDHLAMAETETA